MNNLLDIADQQASLATVATTTNTVDFDEKEFKQFMVKNPVWDFFCISKDDYLRKTKAEKEQLIISYYNQMKAGEQITFYCLSRCLLRFLSDFFILFFSKFSKHLEKSLINMFDCISYYFRLNYFIVLVTF